MDVVYMTYKTGIAPWEICPGLEYGTRLQWMTRYNLFANQMQIKANENDG